MKLIQNMSIIIKPNCINVDDEYKNCTNLKKSDVESFLDWSNKQAHLPKITGNYLYKYKFALFIFF